MDDAERAFSDALHRVDTMPIPVRLDPAGFRAAPAARRFPARWVAVAAAFVLVAGLAVWALAGRGGAVPAVPVAPPATNPLVGTTWIATSLQGNKAVAAPDKVPFLQFEPDGTYLGGDPCNRVSGTYRWQGDQLSLVPGPTTEIACNTAQQQRFLDALVSTRRVERTDGTLRLTDAEGNTLATFQWSEAYLEPTTDPSATPPTGSPDDPVSSSVEVRIRNAGRTDFTRVIVTFRGGERVDYGALRAGARSGYAGATDPVYGYAYVKVQARGKTYSFRPKDYVGAQELSPGRYTYEVSIVGGALTMRPVSDG